MEASAPLASPHVPDARTDANGLRCQGRRACAALPDQSTASMLFRHVDLDLADYQFLSWHWYIERTAGVDLREIYRHIWPGGRPRTSSTLRFSAIPKTHGYTVSYFADVKLRR